VIGLYVSVFFLGLSAVDPVGIGIMPILLLQRNPYKRVVLFLSGSFVSLMIMGILFAKGLGGIVLHFEYYDHWFVPVAETIASILLLIIALVVYVRLHSGKYSVEPSGKLSKWLRLGDWQLFSAGALLVAVQSLLDIVFVIAMVRVGQSHLSSLSLAIAVTSYSIAALLIQIAVIWVFRFTPSHQRIRMLGKVHALLVKYSNQALIIISLGLSCLLFLLAA
jgi:hypothetical protein